MILAPSTVPQPRPCAPISLLGLDNLTGLLITGLILTLAGLLALALLARAARDRHTPSWAYAAGGAVMLAGLALMLLSFSPTC